MRKAKDCCNCMYEFETCEGKRREYNLDKRQVRKLNRTASSYGAWERFYCNNHKYKKGNISNKNKGELL